MRAMVIGLSILLAGSAATLTRQANAQAPVMRAFATEAELTAFFKKRAAHQRRRASAVQMMTPPPMVAVPAPPPAAEPAASDSVVVTGSIARQPSITNTQEADVDEGGIVKVHGRHLVILRRGRLFTVAVDGRQLHPIARIDAFPPGTSGEGAWYDEMLVSGDRVIVVGYSYARGGTEINRFRIGADGRLTYEDSHHLRSNDYYSSTNYASRLIGDQLIFYTPLALDETAPIAAQLPGLRRWTGNTARPFQRIAPPTRVFVPAPIRRDLDAAVSTLHTVTTCDLAAAQLRCTATGVLGSESRNFYVSGNAVYVWIGDVFDDVRRENRALVYRLPLDGGRPGAVQAWGGPVDQFSFREDRARRVLDVLVRAESGGDRMWRPKVSDGEAALVRLPIAVFGDGSALAPRTAYRPLPLDGGESWSFHNRFVGNHLVYSAGEFAEERGTQTVFAVPLAGGSIARLRAPHGVDRIDVMGLDAVVIGNDARERLGFSSIEFGRAPRLGDTSFLPATREGEDRSQAFFFRPDDDKSDGASGMLGLPVTKDLGDSPAARLLGSGSAVAFLRRDARHLSPAGELAARAEDARDDGCEASCVDWYGNARPIFLGDRIFALMGYELVEGTMRGGRIGEVGRVSFAPPPVPRR